MLCVVCCLLFVVCCFVFVCCLLLLLCVVVVVVVVAVVVVVVVDVDGDVTEDVEVVPVQKGLSHLAQPSRQSSPQGHPLKHAEKG